MASAAMASTEPTGETSPARRCIWCGRVRTKFTVEHVVPESLGTGDRLILRGCVCGPCNNGFGKIDLAFLKQFEVIGFTQGILRKRGKKPSVDNWPSIAGRYGSRGPELHFNAGPGAVTAFGRTLNPAHASHGVTGASFERSGNVATVRWSQEFGNDPRFLRGLYKIAVGYVAFTAGPDAVLCTEFDAVRAFVRKGKGGFAAFLTGAGSSDRISIEWAVDAEARLAPMLHIEVLGVAFVVDLAPSQDSLRRLVAAAVVEAGGSGWTTLPPGWPKAT